MLGIANSGLVSVDEIRNKSAKSQYTDCKFCGHSNNKGEYPAFGKTYHHCGGKKHFESKCRSKTKRGSSKSSKSESKHDLRRPNGARKNQCLCCVHKIHGGEHHDSSMEDLNEQIQSLFYT